ncbi:MAG: hypothetical protein R3B47_14700 [Bacteroidia bacterium]
MACCALYPELQWEMSIHIGQRLMDAGLIQAPLFNEDTLLRVTRLSMFRKGMMRDGLRLALVEMLTQEEEQVARQAIVEVMESASPAENSVAGYQHQQRWTIQQWELRKLSGESRRGVSDQMEDMLRRGEVQDPVAMHYLQSRNTRPLDFVMPDSWRKVLYPEGISMLGARHDWLACWHCPCCSALSCINHPNPVRLPKALPENIFVCNRQRISARYLNHLGCLALDRAAEDPQALIEAYNLFNEALSRSDNEDMRAEQLPPGPCGFCLLAQAGERSNLEGASKDFGKLSRCCPVRYPGEKVQHFMLREEKTPSTSMELLRPDGEEILRIADDRLSLGSLDATINRPRLGDIRMARYAPPSRKAFASINRLGEVKIHDYDARLLEQLPAGIHQAEIRQLAFSTGASFIATSSNDRTVLIWDIDDKKSLQRLSEHQAPVLDMAFSPDEELIVTAGSDGVAIVTEVKTGIRLSVLVGHRGAVHSVDTWPLGELIVTAGSDSSMRLWDYNGLQLQEIKLSRGITSARFFAAGKCPCSN